VISQKPSAAIASEIRSSGLPVIDLVGAGLDCAGLAVHK
jgi:hypothetical protein